MLRVLCIGRDGKMAGPESDNSAAEWTREMARLVDAYVVIAEARDGRDRGPVRVAENAVVYHVAGGNALYPFRAARLAERLHRAAPFQVVTTEDPLRAGLAGLWFARRNGVALNVENGSLRIGQPDGVSSRRRHCLRNRIGAHVLRHANTIRIASPDQIVPLRDLGVPGHRLFVIPRPAPPPNGFGREEARARLGIAPDEEIAFAAGRMAPGKNVGTLLEAFALLSAQRPARLLLAGDGPSRAGWRRQARRLGSAVQWLGSVQETERMALFAAADVFIAPGMREIGPRAVLEAYAAGCPVVAAAGMGVIRFGLCAHGETGLVVHPCDARGMAEAMGLLLDDPRWARRMAREGRARMEEICAPRRIARQVAAVLRETVRAREPESPFLPAPAL